MRRFSFVSSILGFGTLIWVVAGLSGCASTSLLPLGEWEDDYGIRYVVSEVVWDQNPGGKYHISKCNPEARYLVARNDSSNATDQGLWTRIDWMPLQDMKPFEWAFCLTAYQESSETAAEAIQASDRSQPLVGCNGFPFSRMKPVPAGEASRSDYD